MTQPAGSLASTAYGREAAQQYDDRRFTTRQGLLFGRLELAELERAVARAPRDAYVLEVGCGTARFSEYLARHGYRVVATDASADMIEVASRKCKGLDNVSFRMEAGANLSFAESTFDFVFAVRVTNQTESAQYALAMLREMIRVTRSGGLVLVEFVNSQRPFARKSRAVRLSFGQIARAACECNCVVESRRGVLVFSQSLLSRMPDVLVPLWGAVERAAARVFWSWASRGYILLRKR